LKVIASSWAGGSPFPVGVTLAAAGMGSQGQLGHTISQ
jgi:hypothetical protein